MSGATAKVDRERMAIPSDGDKDGHKGAAEGQLSGGPDRAERARRVLEELRRRLSDPNRPGEERDYLERLIGQP